MGYDMSDEANKIVAITGAARGIGLATAKAFVNEGWQIAMIDIDGVTLRQAKQSIPEGALALEGDVSDPAQVASMFAQMADHFGRLDALVNNAGIAIFKPILETSYAEWREVLATNLDGPFLCAQAAVPVMADTGGGAIVNIASISGLRASTLRVAYGTSKAAVIQLTKQQAAEFSALGIRVNAVAPGPVDTAMAKKVHSPEIRADYHDQIPLGRYGLEAEIADVIVFLCSSPASYINGQILAVDGGFESTGIGLATLRGERRNRQSGQEQTSEG